MFGFKSKSKVVHQRQSIKIVERELGSLTLGEWQQDQVLCAQSRNVLSSPLVRQMLQVLHNSHPAFQVMTSGDTNARAMQQSRCEGYTMCLADLESMGTPFMPQNAVDADFSEEHIPDEALADYKASGKKTA